MKIILGFVAPRHTKVVTTENYDLQPQKAKMEPLILFHLPKTRHAAITMYGAIMTGGGN